MSQERDQRPNTQKCSRLERRLGTKQQRGRTAMQSRTAQNFNHFNGMTLEEYFKNRNGEQSKPKKFLVTSNEFFKEFPNQDVMRRTFMDSKYINMKQDLQKKLQSYDRDLIQKYAQKFELGKLK